MAKYDREIELKSFDETKAGVKGLVDAGITKIPSIFHYQKSSDDHDHYVKNTISVSSRETVPSIPVIDLKGLDNDDVDQERTKIVQMIGEAAETWGFFQIINHGIPQSVLEEMKEGVRRFFEQENEVKKELYTRDYSKPVYYNSNFDLYSSVSTNWRDTFICNMAPNPPKLQDLPIVCSEILMEYSKQVMKVGILLLELISEALGLNPNHLYDIDCAEGLSVLCHYYPPCPQPELTMGVTEHADVDFLTILLQDQIGGLQILNNNQWIDVLPRLDALVVNIGDLLQLISNDRFKSVVHRVVSSHVGPRISIASFFSTGMIPTSKLYGPIKELLSENNPPIYKETTVIECVGCLNAKGLGGKVSVLDHFKLDKTQK
ncbi:1-aminocyclopropane-1-carboxylate oxidase homolog 1-like [Cannabis sativa]|uniref:1-aminocyclopropane-1-carboxylate oxidase homolog 1-like n=1 Tax=Cannabis sativa TaxID=3483 RepID=UPI0029C9E2E1|nr:1-aminocyclopropane-1-carboxylate oxidase homolog 1-like [Cannabis sativa]